MDSLYFYLDFGRTLNPRRCRDNQSSNRQNSLSDRSTGRHFKMKISSWCGWDWSTWTARMQKLFWCKVWGWSSGRRAEQASSWNGAAKGCSEWRNEAGLTFRLLQEHSEHFVPLETRTVPNIMETVELLVDESRSEAILNKSEFAELHFPGVPGYPPNKSERSCYSSWIDVTSIYVVSRCYAMWWSINSNLCPKTEDQSTAGCIYVHLLDFLRMNVC